MKIALIGFGVVGQGVVQILRDKGDMLRDRYGFSPRIVGVATRSRGTVVSADGLSLDWLLTTPHLHDLPAGSTAITGWDALRVIRDSGADVIVEVTPTNLQTAQPALDLCRAALSAGKHLVLANKGPIALAYGELTAAAAAAGVLLRFEATVMAGTPSIRLGMEALAGCTISRARGILNGTTNYMLTQMDGGMTYAQALAEAQALGYAEADPTADVDGWDAAGKVIILAAALFGTSLSFDDMTVRGIASITPEAIAEARAAGERWKLIAEVTPEGGSVQPHRISMSHPLAGVMGAVNAVTFTTDLMGDITLIGAGAGGVQTGFAVLSDLLDIHRHQLAL